VTARREREGHHRADDRERGNPGDRRPTDRHGRPPDREAALPGEARSPVHAPSLPRRPGTVHEGEAHLDADAAATNRL
jgi:hypothetical protein